MSGGALFALWAAAGVAGLGLELREYRLGRHPYEREIRLCVEQGILAALLAGAFLIASVTGPIYLAIFLTRIASTSSGTSTTCTVCGRCGKGPPHLRCSDGVVPGAGAPPYPYRGTRL